MVVSAGPDRIRALSLIRFAMLSLGCVLVAHTAIFMARYGIGPELARGMSAEGHDAYWPAFVGLVGGGTIALTAHCAFLLARLARRARFRRRSADGRALPGYLAELLALWPRLLAVATAIYTVQENLEHEAMFGHLPGLGVLWGPEGAFAAPGLVVVTMLGAALGALVRWRARVLRARIGARQVPRRVYLRGSGRAWRRWVVVGATCAHSRILARPDAGRAPPVPALT